MQDSPTERVGRYQLLEPIGGGPNGSVARAKVFGVAGFERQFAIKRFLPELTSSPSAAQSLSAAARSYGSLEHPRIARMSEFGVAQGQTFTAVELVAGLDAMRLMAESKLGGSGIAAGGALALVSQAARAVGYAHGRGLSHLGLSPTNVIVTADGDVKVTDFGILAATITARPVDTPRLAQRIGYLAPEQLVGESTSAATDVFVLGVIAYELVTGQRAFYGETPQALSQAILAGPPAEPPLPRPIVRVLSRCLARSQFERFPDARAFADALDAALRVAPVPGTRKDIGAQVKAVMDRHAAMNEGMLSGVVALNVGAFRPPDAISAQTLPPTTHSPSPSVPSRDQPPVRESGEGLATTEFVRPDVPVGRPSPLVGPVSAAATAARDNSPSIRDVSPASTTPELKKPPTTVPGLVAPPPIPVPPGISSPQPPPIPSPGAPLGASTMLGMSAAKKPQIPSVLAQIKPKAPPGRAPTPSPVGPPNPIPSATSPIPTFSTPISAVPSGAPVPSLGRGAPPTPPLRLDASDVEDDSLTLDIGAKLDPEVAGLGSAPDAALGDLGLDDDASQTLDTRPESSRYITSPSGQATVPQGQLSSDPPTVPHDIMPEVHKRGGLQPFAKGAQASAARVKIDTSPSIEVVREADALGDAPSSRQQPITSPPFQGEHPTGQMPPELVRDLKRASTSNTDGDPLVEMSLEVLGGERLEVPSIAPGRPSPSPARTLNMSGAAIANAAAPPLRGGPPLERMPSPSPPSLVGDAQAASSRDQPGAGPSYGQASHGSSEAPAYDPSNAGQPGLAQPGFVQVSTVPNFAPPPPTPTQAAVQRPQPSFSLPSQRRSKRRWPLIVTLLLVVGAGVGVFVWQMWEAGKDDGTKVASNGKGSAKSGSSTSGSATSGSGATNMSGSAGSATSGSAAFGSAASGSDASGSGTGSSAVAAGSNAKPETGSGAKPGVGSGSGKEVAQPTGSSDALQIASTPIGARVFIDGADQGVTPVKLPGSADRHTMALLLAGHDLYVAEVDGHGSFQIPLKPVTPSGGAAGIKVIKCKDKDRYYVFVDGKPTGMTCPTERIECEVGSHTVEVYDLVTENRRKWDIKVTDTRLSYRVRVD